LAHLGCHTLARRHVLLGLPQAEHSDEPGGPIGTCSDTSETSLLLKFRHHLLPQKANSCVEVGGSIDRAYPDVHTAGVPVKVVSERLGHSSPAFTMSVYRHVLPGMQADAALTFADAVFGASESGSPR
jgi:hypothetical protein